jgi:hypothetical protein
MAFCPKCGAEVSDDMAFCPKCGAQIKGAQAVSPPDWRSERRDRRREEKAEKNEKQEKGEKYEKREHPFTGPLIGGLILILLGVVSYLQILGYNLWQYIWPFILIIIGLAVLLGALARMARKRNPPT